MPGGMSNATLSTPEEASDIATLRSMFERYGFTVLNEDEQYADGLRRVRLRHAGRDLTYSSPTSANLARCWRAAYDDLLPFFGTHEAGVGVKAIVGRVLHIGLDEVRAPLVHRSWEPFSPGTPI